MLHTKFAYNDEIFTVSHCPDHEPNWLILDDRGLEVTGKEKRNIKHKVKQWLKDTTSYACKSQEHITTDFLNAVEVQKTFVSSITGTRSGLLLIDDVVVTEDWWSVNGLLPPKTTKKKEEDTMAHLYVEGIEAAKKNHLTTRVREVYYQKDADLRKAFALDNDDRPRSPKELVERIQMGKFILPDEETMKKCECYYAPADCIIWRDPAKKADEAGYEASLKLLDAAKTKAVDAAIVLPETEGLKALQEFESATFH